MDSKAATTFGSKAWNLSKLIVNDMFLSMSSKTSIHIYLYIDCVYGFYGIKESFEHILQLGGLYQIVQTVSCLLSKLPRAGPSMSQNWSNFQASLTKLLG